MEYTKKMCPCGFPQSWHIPHEHDQTDREKEIIEHFRGTYEENQKAIKALADACKAQHDAIDVLFAKLITLDESFLPSKSGKLWEALLEGNEALETYGE